MFGYSNYHIVYPSGDRTKLSVVEISFGLEYELSDYDVASRQSFPDEDDAIDYAKRLADDNNLIFEHNDNEYLD